MSNPADILPLLDRGLAALQRQDYRQAIADLTTCCHQIVDAQDPYFVKAQMALARAYRGLGDTQAAIELCQTLINHPDREVNQWAWSLLALLDQGEAPADLDAMPTTEFKAQRADKNRVHVSLPRVADSYFFVLLMAILTPLLLGALLTMGIGWILGQKAFLPLLYLGLGVTFLLNGSALLFSNILMDWQQRHFYQTQWINLGEVQKYSPEAGELLLRICRRRNIKLPRLGFIDDRRPMIFSYGIFRQQSRLIVSKGVFRYLDNEEIALLYAHELGHILSADSMLMTFVSAWGQVFYSGYGLLYQVIQKVPGPGAWLLLIPTSLCYGLFQINQACNLYFSRSREYYADHFAVEHTGNPNALVRALVKLSKAIVKQERQAEKPALFLEALRNFGIYDPLTTGTCERANRFVPQTIYRLLAWDWSNPWHSLLAWRSSHPLLGKRVLLLTHYAEQLGLNTEYHLASAYYLPSELKPPQRYQRLTGEIFIANLPILGAVLGSGLALLSGVKATMAWNQGLLLGLGLGLLSQSLLRRFLSLSLSAKDILTLLSEPALSPVQGTNIQWQGKLRLRQSVPGKWPKLYFHDRTAVIPVRYPYWLHWQFPFRSPVKVLEPFLEHTCTVTGQVQRGLVPYLTLYRVTAKEKPTVHSYAAWPAYGLSLVFLVLAYYWR
ncbi:M48 family metalloprotease [Synechocystis sp. LKSZ1]|uniref:M48 family metalloprotease n=1 Tax=Synechocystis sp. LKSZ1 TaxID=3144951 RepID=UPI00336C1C6D